MLQYVEVIGSWCEYLYAQSGYLANFDTSLRTLDVDFLIKNMRKTSEKVNLEGIATKNGYNCSDFQIIRLYYIKMEKKSNNNITSP